MSWTKPQYDAMQERAHRYGMHLLTPYRKNLKNIRVGVITVVTDPASEHKTAKPRTSPTEVKEG